MGLDFLPISALVPTEPQLMHVSMYIMCGGLRQEIIGFTGYMIVHFNQTIDS